MKTAESSGRNVSSRTNSQYVWLLLGVVASIFSTGQWAVAPAAWLAPIFLLRFARLHQPLSSFIIISLAGLPALMISWQSFPFGGWVGLVIFAVVASVIGSLPYLVDRALAPVHGFARSLAFPIAVTAIEYVGGQGELGSWGATAYSQIEWAPVRHLLAVGGLSGVAFLIAWGAALLNEAIESTKFLSVARARAVHIVVLLVLLAAGTRLALVDKGAERSIRAAALSTGGLRIFPDAAWEKAWLRGTAMTTEQKDAFRSHHRMRFESLLTSAEEQLRAGAQLVATSEAAFVVLDDDETKFKQRVAGIAARFDAVIAVGVMVLPTSGNPRWKNAVVTFDGANIVGEYRKAIPAPGKERAMSQEGDRQLGVHATRLAKLGIAICYDADFPHLFRGAGAAGIEVFIIPAADWPEVAKMHSDMARARAAEQGISVIRPAANGIATLIDSGGRILARSESSPEGVTVLVRDLPVGTAETVYSRIGDLIGYSSVFVLIGWIVIKLVLHLRTRFVKVVPGGRA